MTDKFGVLRRAGATLAITAAVAVVAACGTGAGRTATGSDPVTSAATSSADATQAAAARSSALKTINGTTVHIPNGGPSVLAFISVGCADCAAAAKAVAQASHTLGEKATFLAVDLDPGIPRQALTGFLDYVHAADLPVAIDTKFSLSKRYAVAALSTVLVINPAGKVSFRQVNPSPGAITAAVNAAT